MTRNDRIVVGVDGGEGGRAATRWAAREAARLGADLRLVHAHAVQHVVGSSFVAAYPPQPWESTEALEQLVAGTAREADGLLPPGRVTCEVLRAERRNALLQEAAEARMMVLGDATRSRLERLATGSVAASVAAHSPTPVVVVPVDPDGDRPAAEVVAAVKLAGVSQDLVRFAFEQAAAHGAPLILLHAWELLAEYDDAIAAHADLPAWERRATAELTALRDLVAGDFPGVAASVRVVHAQPAQALVDASTTASLLVMTRRPHGFPFGHLGATGRTVLRETRCPTAVLPPALERVELPVTDRLAAVAST